MKKIAALILGLLALIVAAQAEPALRAEYEGFGFASLKPEQAMQWENPEVAVQDENGTAFEVQILRADEDDIHIRIPMIEDGRTYEISVSGPDGGETLSCALYADPDKSALIDTAIFDGTDDFLELKFNFPVTYGENFSATIADMNGKEFAAKSIVKDFLSLDIRIEGLAYRKSHTITISGIAADAPEAPEALKDFSGVYTIKFTASPPCCA